MLTTKSYEISTKAYLEKINKNRDPDIPRRASVAGHYASKLVQLEVWLQEELFAITSKNLADQERKEKMMTTFTEACVRLAQQIPQLKPVLNYYILTVTKFNEEAEQKHEFRRENVVELGVKIEELKEEIGRSETEFEALNKELRELLDKTQKRRIELQNLRELRGFQ